MRTSAWRVPVSVTRVYLSVEVDRPVRDISRALGVVPTTTRRFTNLASGREVTSWKLELAIGPATHQVVRDAGQRLVALGEDTAANIAAIVGENQGTAALVIAQYASSDPATTGIELVPELVQWLARASALVTIDQRVVPED